MTPCVLYPRGPFSALGSGLAGLTTLVLACCSPAPPDGNSLAEFLACHDAAVGGARLREASEVNYRLSIVEPGFEVEGRYRATRDPLGGTARIDIYADGERVFSEGWDGQRGWQLPGGSTDTIPTSPDGTAALRHGLEQPGHLWTLADMPSNGHDLEIEAVGEDRITLRLTLADGFEQWYEVDPEACHIVSTRSFRAFHPDLDPEATWIETRYGDFFTAQGITRPRRSWSIDRVTGDTVAVTTILEVDVR